MFALADCNNFYASCERVFRPELNDKPVLVLSNNDGCVIARSNECKALGIPMGAPFFKIRSLLERHGVTWCSSQYTLYGDMSSRVMNNLARFTPDVEVYSIDECFLYLGGFSSLESYATEIRKRTIQCTGIPISIGVAPTKVLAKAANKLAKKGSGTLVVSGEQEIRAILENYPVGDLWGIGSQYEALLGRSGVTTALQLREMPISWVQKHMSITGVRLWRELWGESCIPLNTVLEPRKAMCTSRGFGKVTGDLEELRQATASYASRLSFKLRREKLCATVLSVKLLTNRFKTDSPQFFPSIKIPLSNPVNNTLDIVKMAQWGLRQIYKTGYLYQKVEVMVTGLVPESEVQLNLFTGWDGERLDRITEALDALNRRYGPGTIGLASEGSQQKWAMRRAYLSPCYTTDWKDIIHVH